MNESAVDLTLTIVFITFMIAAAFKVKKAKSKRVEIDIFFTIPVVLTMSLAVAVNISHYWRLLSLKENVITSQADLDKTQKAPENIEQACATRYKDGTNMIVSGDITLKKMPNTTESEVITGITSK